MKKGLMILFLSLCHVIANAQTDSIGIYMTYGDTMQKINPIKYIQTKSNAIASAFTYGIVSTKMKTIFRGNSSDNIATPDTKFYLYFTSNIDPMLMMTYFAFAPGNTPKDFILAKFVPKKKTRELMVGKVNIYAGVMMGVDDSTGVELETKKIRDGLYEISFASNPEPGEYCFMFVGPNGAGGYMPVYDFSIEQP